MWVVVGGRKAITVKKFALAGGAPVQGHPMFAGRALSVRTKDDAELGLEFLAACRRQRRSKVFFYHTRVSDKRMGP